MPAVTVLFPFSPNPPTRSSLDCEIVAVDVVSIAVPVPFELADLSKEEDDARPLNSDCVQRSVVAAPEMVTVIVVVPPATLSATAMNSSPVPVSTLFATVV